MNFNNAAGILSIGLAMATFFVLLTAVKNKEEAKEFGLRVLLFAIAVFAPLYWCLIVGFHWLIKAW